MNRNVLDAEKNPATPKLPPQVQAFYRQAEEDYDGFWEKTALDAGPDIHWFRKWERVFDWQYPTFKWYVGGTTNIVETISTNITSSVTTNFGPVDINVIIPKTTFSTLGRKIGTLVEDP